MGSASKFVDSNTPIVAAPPVAMVIHNVIPTIVEITAVAPHMRGAIANTVAHRTIAMARPKCDTGHRPTVAAELGHDCKNKNRASVAGEAPANAFNAFPENAF